MIASTSPRFGFGDHDPGDERAEHGRKAHRRGDQAGDDHREKADREEQLGVLGPRRLREEGWKQEAAEEQQGDGGGAADRERGEQRDDALGARRRSHRAEGEDDRDQRQILEQQHAERGPANGRVRADQRNDDGGRGQSESEPEGDGGGNAFAEQVEPGLDRNRATGELGGADSEHQPPHRPQPAERQLEPDREEQEHDAELGERFDPVRVGDGDVVEPRILPGQRAEPGRADQHADEDEADDRADADSGKGGDDDPGGAEDHQRVAVTGRAETGVHAPV